MLLFLTNIGDVMAKIFRFFYARSIRLKYRLISWHKRRKTAKSRHANFLVSRMARASWFKTLNKNIPKNQSGSICTFRNAYLLILQDVNKDLSGNFLLPSTDVQDSLTARAQIEQFEVIASSFFFSTLPWLLERRFKKFQSTGLWLKKPMGERQALVCSM